MGFMPHSHDYSILLQYIHCPKILCVPPLHPSLLSNSWHPLIFFTVSKVLIQNINTPGTVQYVAVTNWFLSLQCGFWETQTYFGFIVKNKQRIVECGCHGLHRENPREAISVDWSHRRGYKKIQSFLEVKWTKFDDKWDMKQEVKGVKNDSVVLAWIAGVIFFFFSFLTVFQFYF